MKHLVISLPDEVTIEGHENIEEILNKYGELGYFISGVNNDYVFLSKTEPEPMIVDKSVKEKNHDPKD